VYASHRSESRRQRVMFRPFTDTTLLVWRSWLNFRARQTVTRLPSVTIERDGGLLAGEIPHGVLFDQAHQVLRVDGLDLDLLLRELVEEGPVAHQEVLGVVVGLVHDAPGSGTPLTSSSPRPHRSQPSRAFGRGSPGPPGPSCRRCGPAAKERPVQCPSPRIRLPDATRATPPRAVDPEELRKARGAAS
jgi:hypothetical protein